jgi:outer membrane protein
MMLAILMTLLATDSQFPVLPGPLTQALQAARRHNHMLGISRAQLAQQQAALTQALAAMTPVLQASGAYLRNQYDYILPANAFNNPAPITMQAHDSWTATAGVNVPLLTPGSYARYAEARSATNAAAAGERVTDDEVLLSTARTYYQVVAAQGVLDASVRALATARDSLNVAEIRHREGVDTELAVDRAKVDVSRAGQTVATAKQTLGVARRTLETLTGEKFSQDLPSPAVLETPAMAESHYVELAQRERPEIMQDEATLAQRKAALAEAWSQLAPTLTGNAAEHYTNAAGFVGQKYFWTAGVNLSWSLDPVGTPASIRRSQAAVEEQQQRLMQTEDTVRDDVHTVWLEIEADRARYAEAADEVVSARSALEQAKMQFQAGTATSLDVSSAERDAFNAEASLAQARADLAAALFALRKAAGEPLLEEP